MFRVVSSFALILFFVPAAFAIVPPPPIPSDPLRTCRESAETAKRACLLAAGSDPVAGADCDTRYFEQMEMCRCHEFPDFDACADSCEMAYNLCSIRADGELQVCRVEGGEFCEDGHYALLEICQSALDTCQASLPPTPTPNPSDYPDPWLTPPATPSPTPAPAATPVVTPMPSPMPSPTLSATPTSRR